MKLFLSYSGEGPTDNRFIPVIVERLIIAYYSERAITVEFSWIVVPKEGSSHDNILKACEEGKEYNLILFHRDSGSNSWKEAYENHFLSAVTAINADKKGKYNKNLVPVIPVTEIEAWMLCNKEVFKQKLDSTLSDQKLELTYRAKNIESIGDPKSKIERAILLHNRTLTPKQRKYAVKISDLYDAIAAETPIADLERLDAFQRFRKRLFEVLNVIN